MTHANPTGLSRIEIEKIAEVIATESELYSDWNFGNIATYIDDVLGKRISIMDAPPNGSWAVRVEDGLVKIFLPHNMWTAAQRRRYTAMMFGHVVLHSGNVPMFPGGRLYWESIWFAMELLLPANQFVDYFIIHGATKTAKHFDVDHEMVKYRIDKLGVV